MRERHVPNDASEYSKKAKIIFSAAKTLKNLLLGGRY